MWTTRNNILKLLVKFVVVGFVSYFMVTWFFLRKRKTSASLPAFHSNKTFDNLFLYDGISLFQNKSCSCQNMRGMQVYHLHTYFSPDEVKFVRERRKKEMSHFQSRHAPKFQKILLAVPDSPLSYPIYGVEVMPLHTILIPGLKIHRPDDEIYEMKLQVTLGTLNILVAVSHNVVQGRGEKKLIISSLKVAFLNYILQHITYTSSIYQNHAVDVVTVELSSHKIQFPVVIRQPHIAKLYDPGEDKKINSMVTICTKTFLRYYKLLLLIESIRRYYPNITIIVADDSKTPEKLQDPHVEQYFMPYGKGWFAGRNLAVSQVTTKYFLWVDDDFLFNENTKIEKMVEVLENTDLDVVGGVVAGHYFNFKLLLEEGDEEGHCLHWRSGFYYPLEGFPNCTVTGGVVNFFLAHTEKARSVGFDPKHQRVAHSEFFIDGLGTLLVGQCNDVKVDHQKKKISSDPKNAEMQKIYSTFRTERQNNIYYKLGLLYFKNHLKCFTRK
uniref:Beta-1,4 N-acetylgalactosaminyltransferase 2 n=1 Tax=Geotrypetes seraphini TaxID=260995 RepID=A0A6P8PF76_GEOSA|nr:beta-1,4 N-acetylgalactosaminyltransferase 2 [Geotrypetes seraphini]